MVCPQKRDCGSTRVNKRIKKYFKCSLYFGSEWYTRYCFFPLKVYRADTVAGDGRPRDNVAGGEREGVCFAVIRIAAGRAGHTHNNTSLISFFTANITRGTINIYIYIYHCEIGLTG